MIHDEHFITGSITDLLITDLHCRGVYIKLLEDGKGLLEELIANGNVSNIRSIIVVQSADVLHHTGTVSFDCCENKKVLQIPAQIKHRL